MDGKNLFIYYNDSSNYHVKKHDTEYFGTQLPWELKRLFRDGLVDIKRAQFTMYHNEEEEEEERDEEERKGDRKYTCFFQCIINWDEFREEQDYTYWRCNVNYP